MKEPPTRPGARTKLHPNAGPKAVKQNRAKQTGAAGKRIGVLIGEGHPAVHPYNAAPMPEGPRKTDVSQDPQKSWQSRIGEATDAIAQSFVESISYDKRLYKHDIA